MIHIPDMDSAFIWDMASKDTAMDSNFTSATDTPADMGAIINPAHLNTDPDPVQQFHRRAIHYVTSSANKSLVWDSVRKADVQRVSVYVKSD